MSDITTKVEITCCAIVLVSEKEGEKERWYDAKGGVISGMRVVTYA